MHSIPLIICFCYNAFVVVLHKQVVDVSNAPSKSACVKLIVLFDTSKNKSPNKTRYVEFIKTPFYKNIYIITICAIFLSMNALTYFPLYIIIFLK